MRDRKRDRLYEIMQSPSYEPGRQSSLHQTMRDMAASQPVHLDSVHKLLSLALWFVGPFNIVLYHIAMLLVPLALRTLIHTFSFIFRTSVVLFMQVQIYTSDSKHYYN